MKYSIDSSDKKPAYMQLYYQIRHDIESGAYPYGHRLMSKRALAEEVGKSVITVEHAYALLCNEGYVEAKERSGYVVIYKESDFISHSREEESLHEIKANEIKSDGTKTDKEKSRELSKAFSHTQQESFPFFSMSKTMRRVLLDYGERIYEKPDNKGCIELREAISRYLSRSVGIDADAEQIIIGSGAEYLYGLVAQLIGSDRVFALENPSYEKIHQVYEAHGITCEMLSLGHRGIKTSQLARSRAQILHVTPFNSYPSHITADASKRKEYLLWAKERGGYIIEDNFDSELTVSKKNEETLYSLSEGNVIYMNTFSRTVSSSLRVGYMVLPEQLLEEYDRKLGFYSCTVSVFEQYVLAELINGGEFERNINRIRRAKRRALTQSGNMTK